MSYFEEDDHNLSDEDEVVEVVDKPSKQDVVVDEEDIDFDDDDEDDDDDDDEDKMLKVMENKFKKERDADVNDNNEEEEEDYLGPKYTVNEGDDDEYEDDEDEYENDSQYLKKISQSVTSNQLLDLHPECVVHNLDEVQKMTKIYRNSDGIVIDDLHRTIPFMTKYEQTRILGQRAKQLQNGSSAFVDVPENVIDEHIIARIELDNKKIPFIIRRPLPNGGSEYWNVADLEIINETINASFIPKIPPTISNNT